jgi:hypothetical protein
MTVSMCANHPVYLREGRDETYVAGQDLLHIITGDIKLAITIWIGILMMMMMMMMVVVVMAMHAQILPDPSRLVH